MTKPHVQRLLKHTRKRAIGIRKLITPGEVCPLVKGDADGHGPDRGSAVKAQSRAGMAATDIQTTAAKRPILAADS